MLLFEMAEEGIGALVGEGRRRGMEMVGSWETGTVGREGPGPAGGLAGSEWPEPGPAGEEEAWET